VVYWPEKSVEHRPAVTLADAGRVFPAARDYVGALTPKSWGEAQGIHGSGPKE